MGLRKNKSFYLTNEQKLKKSVAAERLVLNAFISVTYIFVF